MKSTLLHRLQMREAVSRLRHLDVSPKAIKHFIAMPDTLIPASTYGIMRTVSEEDADFLAEISSSRQILPYLMLENNASRLVLYVGANPLNWKDERPVFYRGTAYVETLIYKVDGSSRYMECYNPSKIERSICGGIEWKTK